MLDALGFEVLEADRAADALRQLEASSGAALLCRDINRPGGMDGRDLAHAVRARWPETRIIVCSVCDPLEAALLPRSTYVINRPCSERVVREVSKVLQLG